MSIKLNNRVIELEQKVNDMEDRMVALEQLATAPVANAKPEIATNVVEAENLVKKRGKPGPKPKLTIPEL